MNIEKLIEAAQEIDRLAALQEAKTKQLTKLANYARDGLDRSEVKKRMDYLDKTPSVFDFSDAINKLRKALKTNAPRRGL